MRHGIPQIRSRSAHRRWVGLLFEASFLLLTTAGTAQYTHQLKTLTTVREAHDLAVDDAALGYPIHLRGVVTFYDPNNDPRWISLFMKDSTASMFVAVPRDSPTPTPAGTIVDVRGVSAVGGFAPIVDDPHVTAVGTARLPPYAPRVSLGRLLSGAEDGQWVEATGVIRSVFVEKFEVILQLAMDDGLIGVVTPRQAAVDYNALVDASVLIHANAAPLFNEDHQMVGARLLVPNISALRVLKPPPSDPFASPITAIGRLSQFNPLGATPHRVHLRGRVSLQWPGSLICIQQEKRALCAQTLQTTPVPLGTAIDLVGFASSGTSAPILSDATFRSATDLIAVAQRALTGKNVLQIRNDAQLVSLEGELIATDRSAAETTFLLSSGGVPVTAVLPTAQQGVAGLWVKGSTLQVTGICSVLVDTEKSAHAAGNAVPKSFRLLLRSQADVQVLETPSWWSPDHAIGAVSCVLALSVMVLGWVAVLRRRVHQQTEVIRESEEKFRYLALHDTLTGLATRRLLSERLEAALARSRARHPLAILMLDVDSFKQINDMHGHAGGDQVLRATARRLASSVRKDDTVARMGGDEFVVLLNDVTATQAEAIAAKIVDMLSVPIEFEGYQVPVTVSVGVCMVGSGPSHPDTLLKSADEAMYQAKARGKHRFHVFDAELVSA